ncbi:hypothetical protein CYMTET_51611 [Cymbomonas tetramitiformis]|uniref:Transmembrane protein n=1 Tax=Cymbomonas tetramitiformis TaxID=36881 RepID=A0AAE0ETI0_9CHLO|nr:hypothetical protein CYMTET_51611 [Cymbomonas tetramitiformis]
MGGTRRTKEVALSGLVLTEDGTLSLRDHVDFISDDVWLLPSSPDAQGPAGKLFTRRSKLTLLSLAVMFTAFAITLSVLLAKPTARSESETMAENYSPPPETPNSMLVGN